MKAGRFRCMCGVVHALPLERLMDGLGVTKWACTGCRRKFVLVQDEGNVFMPVFIDPGVRVTEARETGPGSAGPAANLPMPPPAIDFTCRCGGAVTAHSWNYASTIVCPHCRSTLYAALKYNPKRGMHVIVPSYPPPGKPAVGRARPGAP